MVVEFSLLGTIVAALGIILGTWALTYLYVTIGRTPLVAQVHANDQVEVNQDIDLVFDMSKTHFFDLQTEEVII